jgi:hypothetical protein
MDLLEAIFALLRAVLKAVTEKSDDALLDRAYACFGFLGLVTLLIGIAALLSQFGLMNFKEGSNGFTWTLVFGMFLGPLLLVGMLVASVWGVVLTVKFWRHSALVVLSVVSMLCGGGLLTVMAIEWGVYPGSSTLTHAMDIAGGAYIAANVLIPAWWFAMGRRRYRSEAHAQE